MSVLTPLQRRLLREIGRSPQSGDFYLSGGTALAAFYLQHRYSLDMNRVIAPPFRNG